MASIFRGSGRASCSSNSYLHICFSKSRKMDAIRKKMQSLKSETDSLYSIIHNFEEETKESNRRSDQADCDIRDYGKKVHGLEIEFDETCDKLQKATESLEEKEKMYREVEGDVSALHLSVHLLLLLQGLSGLLQLVAGLVKLDLKTVDFLSIVPDVAVSLVGPPVGLLGLLLEVVDDGVETVRLRLEGLHLLADGVHFSRL